MKRYFPILIVFLLISCSLRKPAEKYPDKLIIGFPVGSSGGAFKKWYGPVADYLKRTLNLKSVEFFTSSDYAPVIEAMKAKKVDIAYFGELSYIIAHEKAGAEALVMHVTSDGTPLPTKVGRSPGPVQVFTQWKISGKDPMNLPLLLPIRHRPADISIPVITLIP